MVFDIYLIGKKLFFYLNSRHKANCIPSFNHLMKGGVAVPLRKPVKKSLIRDNSFLALSTKSGIFPKESLFQDLRATFKSFNLWVRMNIGQLRIDWPHTCSMIFLQSGCKLHIERNLKFKGLLVVPLSMTTRMGKMI